MGATAVWIDGDKVFAELGDVARRIVVEIADEAERETVADIVRRAPAILGQAAYRLNGERELSADAKRRLLNAIGAQWGNQ